ncbi:MAG TPA: PEP-CTERM sorting domain-containing protein [Syntrophorhabdales bacterium]|nr:PEP-CTERM sorting domain-containing protein [Syntrophorhabdales bacterium]
MKKSFTICLAFCIALALFVVPGMAVADNDVPLTGLRDMSLFQSALPVVDLTNGTVLLDPPVINYTPQNANSPGWLIGQPLNAQNTYVIDLTDPIGTQLPAVPGLHPSEGVSGLLVLADTTSLSLPSTQSGWLALASSSHVEAIVAFVPGASTAVVYEKHPTSAPEPGVLLLLGSGLIGLVGMRRILKA